MLHILVLGFSDFQVSMKADFLHSVSLPLKSLELLYLEYFVKSGIVYLFFFLRYDIQHLVFSLNNI